MPLAGNVVAGNQKETVSVDQSAYFQQQGNIQFQILNGFTVHNPSQTLTLWISKSGIAAPEAAGSYGIPPLGTFSTSYGERFTGVLGLYGVQNQPFTLSTY